MNAKSQIERGLELVRPFLGKCAFDKSGIIEEGGDMRSVQHVELRMLISGQPNQHLQKWYLTPDTDLEELANEIVTYASQDSESYPNPNRYCVTAHLANAGEEIDSRSPTFTMRGMAIALESQVGPDDIVESDPPTGKGVLGMFMRHTEALQRGFGGAMTGMIQMYRDELHHERSMRMRSQELHFDAIKMFEEMATEKHSREITAKREDAKLEAQKTLFTDFRALVPALVNTLRGKKILPENVNPSEDALMKFWFSLDDEQRNAINSTLRPAQLASMQTLLSAAIGTAKKIETKESDEKVKH